MSNTATLSTLTNIDLANEMLSQHKRYGELSLWIVEAELKIYSMITENKEVQSEISRQLDLKQQAEVEKYIVLSNLKKIELEMDKRVSGENHV